MNTTAKPVRLTVEIDPALHRRAKVVAAQRGEPLAAIVRKLLTSFVERQEAQ